MKAGFGQGLLFFTFFAFYGYSFYVGGRLTWEGVKNGDKRFTGGVILAIMLSVVFGVF